MTRACNIEVGGRNINFNRLSQKACAQRDIRDVIGNIQHLNSPKTFLILKSIHIYFPAVLKIAIRYIHKRNQCLKLEKKKIGVGLNNYNILGWRRHGALNCVPLCVLASPERTPSTQLGYVLFLFTAPVSALLNSSELNLSAGNKIEGTTL